MSNGAEKAPFSAQVLDDLDLKGTRGDVISKPSRPLHQAADLQPTTPSSTGTSRSEEQKASRKEKKEKRDRHHEEGHSASGRDNTKKSLSTDDRHGDGRERRKSSKKSRSRSAERTNRKEKHSKSRDREGEKGRDRERDRERERDRDQDRFKSSSRRNDSRDRHSDRRHHERGERKTDIASVQNRHRESDRPDRHRPKHARDGSQSPDRKRSRGEKPKEDESWVSRRDRDRHSEMEGKPPASTSLAATTKNKPGEWIMDVEGDKEFFRYGGINPLTVPRYSRAGDYEKTRANGSREIYMTEGGRRSKPARYSDPNATWRDASRDIKRITKAKAEELARSLQNQPENPLYISLDVRAGTTGRSSQSDMQDQDDSEDDYDSESKKKVDYRDIHGMSVHKDADEDLLQTTNEQEQEGAESTLSALMRRRTMLDSELRKDPKQPEKWLEFIAVEDEIDIISSRRSAASVAAHSTGHYEIRLSIFDRALLFNPLDERLLLAYMDTCRQCWEPAKVLTKWDELLQSTTILTSWPGLWIEYLNYRQRHFLSFTVKSFITVLQDALARLAQLTRLTCMAMQRSSENTELQVQLVKIECVMVHVIARTWVFLKQAGYRERAQGVLQGQVEFLFNMPRTLMSEAWEIQIGSLGEFWDSELPRFGEKDAKGWSHYVTEDDEVAMESQLENIKLPPRDAPNDELLKAFADNDMDRYQYGRWAKLEKELNNACWFPIRTTDDLPDQLEDDPYGIILFEDIRPFIVSLYSAEARQQFVDCMLTFLGLPINSTAGSNGIHASAQSSTSNTTTIPPVYNPYFHDGLLLNLGMDFELNLDDNPGLTRFFPKAESGQDQIQRVLMEMERERGLLEPEGRDWSCVWNFPLRLFPHSPDTIFGRSATEHYKLQGVRYPWASVTNHDELEHSNRLLIRNTLQQLMEVVPLSKSHRRGLSVYHLMYEALETVSASKSQKLAKKYLKAERMDLELWNSYAQAEKALGRIAEARKIYLAALSMYPTFPADRQVRAPLIHRYYAELEWEQGRKGVALTVLTALAEGPSADITGDEQEDLDIPTATRLIKARKYLSQKVAQLNLGRPLIQQANAGSVGSQWFEPALDWIVCFAWFEYLSASVEAGVSPGAKVFEDAIQEMDFRNPDTEIEVTVEDSPDSSKQNTALGSLFASLSLDFRQEDFKRKKKICTGPEAEMLWIQLARMVYLHSLQGTLSKRAGRQTVDGGAAGGKGGGYQPRDLRRVIRSGLNRFPNCSILQSLFFWTEAQQRLHGRVRTWVQEQVRRGYGKQGGGIVASKEPLWLFGLFYELWNQEPYSTDVVRSLLENALESSSASSFNSSPTLWLIYIELEVRDGSRRLGLQSSRVGRGKDKNSLKAILGASAEAGLESNLKVKQLIMRSINDCPWCKDLYMLAFEPRMRNLFTIEELDQLYQTMLEKGIRVRNDIPEHAARDSPMEEPKDTSDHEGSEEGKLA
ncbi:hypothetical protein BGZ72_001840 [Mortierella alpina]|nr:hypothetical protein BGZ72_001840 [Mortierella alpina]